MAKKLTDAQIGHYRREGFVYPVDALSAEQAARYRRAMETFEAARGQELGKMGGAEGLFHRSFKP